MAEVDIALKGFSLANGGKKENRRALDFYPTPPEATHALMLFLKSRNLMPSFVWECACGDLAMSNVIDQYTSVYSSDITTGTDYLETLVPVGIDAVITNPPFSLSEKFIRKSVGVDEVSLSAYLLKSQYWHSAKRGPLFFEHRPAFVLPLLWRPDFMNGASGGSPTMDVMWTVWINRSTTTEYEPLYKPKL